jgi:hypothetical protein
MSSRIELLGQSTYRYRALTLPMSGLTHAAKRNTTGSMNRYRAVAGVALALAMYGLTPRQTAAQSTRDSAIVLAALGSDIREHYRDIPLFVFVAFDRARDVGIGKRENYYFPSVMDEEAWPLKILASSAAAELLEPSRLKSLDGTVRPVLRILTLGSIIWSADTCSILLRIETPARGPRGKSETVLWRYTFKSVPAGIPAIESRAIVFTAEIFYGSGR